MSESPNTVAAVIPSYDDGEHVLKLVRALKDKGIDHVVVIESGDSSYFKRLEKYSFVTLLNGGRGRGLQMNTASEHTCSDIIWFLHADSDISHIDVEVLRSAPSDSWGNFCIRFSTDHWYFRYIEWQSNFRAKYFHTVFGDQGIWISRSLWNISGGYTPPYEDINMSRTLRKFSKNIVCKDRIVSSPRRFFKHGPVFTHVIMGLIVTSYTAGLTRLATYFYHYIK